MKARFKNENMAPPKIGFRPAYGAEDGEDWLLLKDALQEFRRTSRVTSERNETFWEDQRRSVHARLIAKQPVRQWRFVWVWATAAAVVALGVGLFEQRQEPIRPDFAAGYDQQLLLDIDRALDRHLPTALEPAAILPSEIFPSARISAAP